MNNMKKTTDSKNNSKTSKSRLFLSPLAFTILSLCIWGVSYILAGAPKRSLEPQTRLDEIDEAVLSSLVGPRGPNRVSALQTAKLSSSKNDNPNFPAVDDRNESILDDDIFDHLEDETMPLSSVCSSLSGIDRSQTKTINSEDLSRRLRESILGRSKDPTALSLQPILRFYLSQPLIKEMNGRGTTDIFAIEAKSKTLAKFQVIKAHQAQMEHIMDQSYLLLMMGRVAQQNPHLASDPNVLVYCDQIEATINNLNIIDFNREKEEFSHFLAETKIDPKSIGFDPSYKTNLAVEWDSRGVLSHSLGWVGDLWIN